MWAIMDNSLNSFSSDTWTVRILCTAKVLEAFAQLRSLGLSRREVISTLIKDTSPMESVEIIEHLVSTKTTDSVVNFPVSDAVRDHLTRQLKISGVSITDYFTELVSRQAPLLFQKGSPDSFEEIIEVPPIETETSPRVPSGGPTPSLKNLPLAPPRGSTFSWKELQRAASKPVPEASKPVPEPSKPVFVLPKQVFKPVPVPASKPKDVPAPPQPVSVYQPVPEPESVHESNYNPVGWDTADVVAIPEPNAVVSFPVPEPEHSEQETVRRLELPGDYLMEEIPSFEHWEASPLVRAAKYRRTCILYEWALHHRKLEQSLKSASDRYQQTRKPRDGSNFRQKSEELQGFREAIRLQQRPEMAEISREVLKEEP